MSQLGERLRTARENQGISLAQAAAETRILQRYIVALEDGAFHHLPGDVYTRGFIRNYATYLGIPVEELIELYRQEHGGTEPIRVIPATSAPRIRGLFVPSFFGVFFVVLALIGVGYLILSTTNNIGENSQLAEQPTLAVPTPSPLPTSLPKLVDNSTPGRPEMPTLPPAGMAVSPEPLKTPTPSAPIAGEVRIDPGDHPGSWLHIKVDGQSVFQKVLGADQSLSFTAQRSLWIRAGNAAVVTVMLNGQEPQRLGTTAGQVVTFSWPP